MIANIRDEIRATAEKMQLPFPLTVSGGYIITDIETEKVLDDYVREADEIMYQEKTEKHVNR